MTEMAKLEELAKAWGGRFVKLTADLMSQGLPEGYSEAPFSHWELGVVFETKTLYYDPTGYDWVEVVHEMGHLFATDKPPHLSDEGEWFGWEFALARQVGGREGMDLLREQHGDYSLGTVDLGNLAPKNHFGSYIDLGCLEEGVQWKVIRKVIREAKGVGIVDGRGRCRPWGTSLIV